MNLNKVNNKVNYLLIGLLSILSILRVYIGYKLPYYYYVDSNLDDLFFIRHSDLINHFTLWNPYTLLNLLLLYFWLLELIVLYMVLYP